MSPDCFDDTWTGIPLTTLISWALAPATDEVLHSLHSKGRADAAAWARLTGVGDAAAPDSDDLLRCRSLPCLLPSCPPVLPSPPHPPACQPRGSTDIQRACFRYNLLHDASFVPPPVMTDASPAVDSGMRSSSDLKESR